MVQVFLTMSDWSDSQMKNVHWCKDSIDSCSHPRLFTLGHIPHRSQCLNQRCNEDLQRIWSFLDSPTPQEKVLSLPYIIHLVSIESFYRSSRILWKHRHIKAKFIFLKTESNACLWGYSCHLQDFFLNFFFQNLLHWLDTSVNSKMKLVTSLEWLYLVIHYSSNNLLWWLIFVKLYLRFLL